MGYKLSKNYYKIIVLKDRKIYHITNPIFLEDKYSFLSDKSGKQDLISKPIFREAY